jgi:threonine dehydrogenase-like Zn-dependent dehydrogenase
MGANFVVDPGAGEAATHVREILQGRLADLVIEVVGHREQALNLCVTLCRQEGRLLSFGVPNEIVDGLRWNDLFWKNITIHTSVGPDFRTDFPLAMQWIAEGRINVKPLVTHRYAVQDVQQAFDLFHSRRDGVLKVLLDFPA